MVSLSARAFVEDPIAFTELRMVFHNPEARVREGRFEIDLPPGAAISRFAMKIDGRWQEAEVVERQAARRAYEDFLHRRQDPALMEKKAGNQFRARVFPIPANGTKELIISYSQRLDHSAEPYRIHVQGLPKLDTLSAEVVVGDGRADGLTSAAGGAARRTQSLTIHEQSFAPTTDLEVRIADRPSVTGLRNGRLALGRVPIDLRLQADEIDAITVLFDTSASRALGYETQIRRLGALLESIERAHGSPIDARVIAYDQESSEVYRGDARGFIDAGALALETRGPLGASDLGGALRRLATEPNAPARILVVTDGILTSGETEHERIRDAVQSLGDQGTERVDALVVGGIRDDVLLDHLVGAGLAKTGVVADGRLTGESLLRKLTRTTRSDVRVSVPGAEWVWPRTLDGIQPGDEVMVFADLPEDRPFVVELEGIGDVEIPTRPAPAALLDRVLARAEIDRFSAMIGTQAADDVEKRRALEQKILQLSTRHRVLSNYTALLVLETDADYARFGIERDALADILTVGPAGITTVDRKAGLQIAVPAPRVGRDEWAKNQADDADKEGDEKLEAKDARTFSARKKMVLGGGEDPLGDAGGAPSFSANAPEDAAPEGAGPPPSPSRPPDLRDPFDEVAEEEEEPPSRGNVNLPATAERAPPASARAPARRRGRGGPGDRSHDGFERADPKPEDAWDGEFARIMAMISGDRIGDARRAAMTWRAKEPGSELALLALGEAAEAAKDWRTAARAYGSLIDLFSSRADIRRMAGQRFERLAQRMAADGGVALTMAIDTYAHAVEQRPDHPASHRLYAYALAKAGRWAEAFDAIEAGAKRDYPGDRFRGVKRILSDDVGLIAAGWRAAAPAATKNLKARLDNGGWSMATGPSTRFVLVWETDANDVDFHIYDGARGHAYYSQKQLGSGGELYADVTTGYGPECFTIPGKPRAYPYSLQAHYYSRGPMGYGMGKLQVVQHDGRGALRFDEQPFVIMRDGATVNLGRLEGPLPANPG
jgi:tetratricopeptide (TPR) repeat protein